MEKDDMLSQFYLAIKLRFSSLFKSQLYIQYSTRYLIRLPTEASRHKNFVREAFARLMTVDRHGRATTTPEQETWRLRTIQHYTGPNNPQP